MVFIFLGVDAIVINVWDKSIKILIVHWKKNLRLALIQFTALQKPKRRGFHGLRIN